MEEQKKAYVVLLRFSDEAKDEATPTKVFTSLLKAQCYCEAEAHRLQPNSTIQWEDSLTLLVTNGSNPSNEWCFDIHYADLDEDVEIPKKPEIEAEVEALRKENLQLRDKISDQMAIQSAALAYLVMWDGGWKYSKDHVIENMHAARNILEKSPSGKASIEKLLERWKGN